MPRTRIISAALAALLLISATAGAATAASLFDTDTILQVRISGPLQSLLNDDDNNELPFTLNAEGIGHQIKVRIRGNSRRRVCEFPPLRLNFVKKRTAGTVFAGQDKLRLVTHCSGGDRAQAALLGEYAAYRIFSQLTPLGYRVRLMSITYTDSEGKLDPLSAFGFLIESPHQFATRTDASPLQVDSVSLSSFDRQHLALVFIFQFMIGNTDWSMVRSDNRESCCHNGDIYKVGSRAIYVPYDFDLSGLANPVYARPDPALRITRVTQRRYRGYCMTGLPLNETLSEVVAQKDAVLASVASLPVLTERRRRTRTRFLERFFQQAHTRSAMTRNFERSCLR